MLLKVWTMTEQHRRTTPLLSPQLRGFVAWDDCDSAPRNSEVVPHSIALMCAWMTSYISVEEAGVIDAQESGASDDDESGEKSLKKIGKKKAEKLAMKEKAKEDREVYIYSDYCPFL